MYENIGSRDRLLRAIIGVILVSALFWIDGTARWLGLIGLVPLGTALFGNCPVYTALGLTTCAEEEA